MTSLRVCVVAHAAGRGGAERALLEMVDALALAGHVPLAIAPTSGWLTAELERRGTPLAIVPYTWWMGRGTPPWKRVAKATLNAATLLPLVVRLRRWRADCVLTNGSVVCSGALAARAAGIPHLWYVHEYGSEHHGLEYEVGRERALRWMVRLSRLILFPSHTLAARFGGSIPERKVRVVYQAVRLPPGGAPAVKREPGRLRCVLVGALQSGKGQEEAVEALGRLVSAGVDAELLLVGSGRAPHVGRIEALAASIGVARRVTLTGEVEPVTPYVEGADVALVCSRYEAFGRTTVEAMLAGTPVVGARSGATEELVRDGETGLLYPPGDVDALASRILEIHRDAALGERLAATAREWARVRFALPTFADALSDVVRTACAPPPTADPDA